MLSALGNLLKQTNTDPTSDPKQSLQQYINDMLTSGANAGTSIATGAYDAAKGVGQYAKDTFTADHNSIPLSVRLSVAGAQTPDDKLKTLQQYYPDASMDSEGQLSFSDPKYGKKMSLDDPGLSVGDTVGRIPDIGEVAGNIAGTIGGIGLGSYGGPAGAYVGGVTGSGLGAATGRELGTETAKGLASLLLDKGSIDNRTLLAKAGDFANTGSINSLLTAIPYLGMPSLSSLAKAGASAGEKAAAKSIVSNAAELPSQALEPHVQEHMDFWENFRKTKEASELKKAAEQREAFLSQEATDKAEQQALAYDGPVGRLNQHLDENYAKGARLNEDHTRVTIPEVPANPETEVAISKYNDCVPALVKNIYEEFGLPNNILTSKFMENGFTRRVPMGKINPEFGTPPEKTMSMLDDFGIVHKDLASQHDLNMSNPSPEDLASLRTSIDEAIDNGSKVMIKQHTAPGGAGHVFLITGKDDASGQYFTSGRGNPSHPYAEGSFKVDPNVPNDLSAIQKPGTTVIPKDAIFGDLGIGRENWKYNAPAFDAIEIKGVKKNLRDLQDTFKYPSAENKPVDFHTSDILQERAARKKIMADHYSKSNYGLTSQGLDPNESIISQLKQKAEDGSINTDRGIFNSDPSIQLTTKNPIQNEISNLPEREGDKVYFDPKRMNEFLDIHRDTGFKLDPRSENDAIFKKAAAERSASMDASTSKPKDVNGFFGVANDPIRSPRLADESIDSKSKLAEQLQLKKEFYENRYNERIDNPKIYLNKHLNGKVARGARFKHGDDIVSPYDPRVVIPEKRPKYMGSVAYSRYGDCVASVVKNVYSDFGLPDDIMYSKFIKNGLLEVMKKDSSSVGRSVVSGFGGKKLIKDLQGFGLDIKPMTEDIRRDGFLLDKNKITTAIDSALDRGSKVMIDMHGKDNSGHVYLISGKDKGLYNIPGIPESEGVQLDRYIAKGRNQKHDATFRNFPGTADDPRRGVDSIYKESVLDDMGHTQKGYKNNSMSYDLYEIKGVKRNFRDLQEDVYKHRETPPVNLNSNKLLKEHAEIKKRKRMVDIAKEILGEKKP